jgi:hypothetical protein
MLLATNDALNPKKQNDYSSVGVPFEEDKQESFVMCLSPQSFYMRPFPL